MVKVEMPRASWEIILYILREYSNNTGVQIGSIAKEISTQVYSQEY